MKNCPNSAKFSTLIAALAFLSTSNAEETQKKLPISEVMIFQCSTKNNKEIKIFKSIQSNQKDFELTYEFKNKADTEMRVSEKSIPGNFEVFSYNSYSRYQTSYTRLTFLRHDYQYSVYSDYDATLPIKEERGVIVKKRPIGNETKIKCLSTNIDKLEEVSNFLSCNQDSALGCL